MDRELILIVDDNPDIRLFVKSALEEEGFEVMEAIDGLTALTVFAESKPTVVILDLSMGQPDGFEVCRKIRMTSDVPIIMLTNRNKELDEAMCLAAGADDYIIKPVSAQILGLRVRNQLRHRNISEVRDLKILKSGVLLLDTESRELMVESIKVPLTRTEYDFLYLLMENPKRVFTREQVIEAIGGSIVFASYSLLDTHASRLRLKINAAGGPRVIAAVRGVGFRLWP